MADTKQDNVQDQSESPIPVLPPLTEYEKDLAAKATQEFNKKNFESCLNLLSQLIAARPNDPKVTHNKTVAAYCLSGYKKTDDFKQDMLSVCAQAQVNIDNIDSLDDVDQCVIYYNQAVILYYLKQHQAALTIMTRLYQFIEPLGEFGEQLARKVLLLLVELYLTTHQPEKAMAMLSFFEIKLLSGGGKSGTPEKGGNGEGSGRSSATEMMDAYRTKVGQYKIRCYIMLKSMKQCKREVKNLMNTVGMTLPVVYLKSNIEYLRGNARKAMKVLNTAPPHKHFMETGESMPVMYYNNLGCLHFHLKKHNLGSFYFRKALQENDAVLKQLNKVDGGKSFSERPLYCLSMSKHFELLYNMGIQHLHCGKPGPAFDCLIEAVQVYQTNPRLWLRLAECCVMAKRESNDIDRSMSQRMGVVQSSIGCGLHRKLILGSGTQGNPESSESAAMPVLSLEFACLCLKNALLLLPEDPSTSNQMNSADDSEASSSRAHENGIVPAPPGNPMRGPEVANLRCSILANSAYVCLCLGDYLVALHHAENLLKQPRLSGAHRYLGHMYKAEALVSLDKIADAVQHLNTEKVTDVSTLPPEHKQETDKSDKDDAADVKGALYPWSPQDVTQARALMLYNLSVAHAVRGEFDKAMTHLMQSTQSIGSPLPAQVFYLRLYLDLIEGRRKTAQGIIKEHFGHMTPNRI